ncbi:MAG TPA: FHA domain-containing protein [Vicinamibacterales bacterium]|jgi:transcriptional regulator with AAA-type ATPase domain/polyferredoxin
MNQPKSPWIGASDADRAPLPVTLLAPVPGRPGSAPPSAIAPATLEVVSGDARPLSVFVGRTPVRLGRGTGNDIVLTDSGVSRVHAEVLYEDGDYVLRDLESSNGTYVDGALTTTTRLRAGMKIELGSTVLRFLEPSPEVSDAERLVLMGRSDLLRALELPTLAAAAKLMTARIVPKGGVLLRQSAPMEGIIFVHRGALRVVEINDEGGERAVGRVEAGNHIGERALVTAVSAPQTLVADEDSCVLQLTMASLDSVMQKEADDSHKIARTILKKLQTTKRHALALPGPGARDDLADLLTATDVEIIGEDKRMLRAKERLEALSKDDQPVLIVGPQGSGKRMFARHFHKVGPHHDDPYVEISLSDPATSNHGAAIFGLEPRTDAPGKPQIGYLEMIGEGTLMIAHAELLGPHLQALLAQYLRLGWFHRVQGKDTVQCRTRVILVATGDESAVLEQLVPELRELVAKRTVVSPALTQRLKDIPLLAEHYLKVHAALAGRPPAPLSREATERLVSYAWPGNVRELENVMQRAAMVASQDNIIPGDLIFVAPPEKEFHKRNLLRDDRIRDFLRRPGLMSTLIWVDIVFVAVVTLFTLYGGSLPAGHPLTQFATNPGMLVTWLVWFPLLPVSAFLVGRIWCGVCPIAGIGDLAGRVKRFNLPAPAILKRLDFWLLAASFIFVDYIEELFGVADRPWATAIFLLVILYFAAAMTVLFERKAFCKYLCPLAGVLGAYSSMSIFEIRGNKKVCQTQCGDHSCHKGTAELEGCPLFAYPASINTNAECMMCLNCVRTCDNRGLQLNLRPPLQELWRNKEPMLAMSVFGVVLVGLMAKHQFPALTWWIAFQQRLGWSDATAHTILFVGFGLLALVPFAVTSMLSAAASRETMGVNAAAYGIAFLPLAFSGHVAHVMHEFLSDGVYNLLAYIVKVWDSVVGQVPIATSTYTVTPFISPAVVTFIAFLLVSGGMVGSAVAIVMIARRRSTEYAIPRLMPHMLLLACMWVGYLVVFTGSTGEPAPAGAAAPVAAVGGVVAPASPGGAAPNPGAPTTPAPPTAQPTSPAAPVR